MKLTKNTKKYLKNGFCENVCVCFVKKCMQIFFYTKKRCSLYILRDEFFKAYKNIKKGNLYFDFCGFFSQKQQEKGPYGNLKVTFLWRFC